MSKRAGTVVLLAGVAGAAFVGGRISTSFEGNAALAEQPEAAGSPKTAEHKHLEQMLGEWEGTVRIKMGEEWTEWETEIEREPAMDGLFVIEHVESDSDMGSYRAMGIIGYNPMEKKYESAWIENMSPAITTSTGTFDQATNTWTFNGEMVDPMSGRKLKTMTVVDTSEKDKESMEGFIVLPDGSKTKNFEATFTRED